MPHTSASKRLVLTAALSILFVATAAHAEEEAPLVSSRLFQGHGTVGGGPYLITGALSPGLGLGINFSGGVTYELTSWARWDFVGSLSPIGFEGYGGFGEFIGGTATTGIRLGTTLPVRLAGGFGATYVLAPSVSNLEGMYLTPAFRAEFLNIDETATLKGTGMGLALEARFFPTFTAFQVCLIWGVW